MGPKPRFYGNSSSSPARTRPRGPLTYKENNTRASEANGTCLRDAAVERTCDNDSDSDPRTQPARWSVVSRAQLHPFSAGGRHPEVTTLQLLPLRTDVMGPVRTRGRGHTQAPPVRVEMGTIASENVPSAIC